MTISSCLWPTRGIRRQRSSGGLLTSRNDSDGNPRRCGFPRPLSIIPTLQVLVKHGMKFLILSPFQALRARPLGATKWTDVSQGRIDPTQPYRCFVRDESGKKRPDQFIDLFFYDGSDFEGGVLRRPLEGWEYLLRPVDEGLSADEKETSAHPHRHRW